jgi:ESCRT-II complex subunit VPS36
VSPDDLRTAAESFSRLQLPVQLRTFPSGVAVVQDQSWSDDAVCSQIMEVISKPDATICQSELGRGLGAAQYAVEVNVPVAVATEQLLLAERAGVLCRDDGAKGLFFYRNFFPELSYS